jgi:hypothetical protein
VEQGAVGAHLSHDGSLAFVHFTIQFPRSKNGKAVQIVHQTLNMDLEAAAEDARFYFGCHEFPVTFTKKTAAEESLKFLKELRGHEPFTGEQLLVECSFRMFAVEQLNLSDLKSIRRLGRPPTWAKVVPFPDDEERKEQEADAKQQRLEVIALQDFLNADAVKVQLLHRQNEAEIKTKIDAIKSHISDEAALHRAKLEANAVALALESKLLYEQEVSDLKEQIKRTSEIAKLKAQLADAQRAEAPGEGHTVARR